MSRHYDFIVVGLGAAGSAALWQLVRRGARVLGLDRFHPPHTRGSSHGDSRITRVALGEGEQYVEFARRSHVIWRELEDRTGQSLFSPVGCLVFGSSSGRTPAHGAADFLQTTVTVARQQEIPHEILTAEALRQRFPQFHFRDEEWGCFEPGAGFVRPEAAIAAQLRVAAEAGATIQTGESLLGWQTRGSSVEVRTDRGTYAAGQLLICAGAWTGRWLPELRAKLRVHRQVLHWFEPAGEATWFAPERMPTFIRVPNAGSAMFYGFPALDGPGGGLKIAGEQFLVEGDPDAPSELVAEEEVQSMFQLASPHLRIQPHCLRSAVCHYTVTTDFHFALDQSGGDPNVHFISACSGHGFKHSPAVGEAVAERILTGTSRLNLSPFRAGLRKAFTEPAGANPGSVPPGSPRT